MTPARPDPRAPRELLAAALLADLPHGIPSAPILEGEAEMFAADLLATPAGARLLALAETTVALLGAKATVTLMPAAMGRGDRWLVMTDGGKRMGLDADLGKAVAAALEPRP